MKVYCKDCKYLHNVKDPKCTHPRNIEIVVKENWYAKINFSKNRKRPSEINKNNDCNWWYRLESYQT